MNRSPGLGLRNRRALPSGSNEVNTTSCQVKKNLSVTRLSSVVPRAPRIAVTIRQVVCVSAREKNH